MNYCLTCWYGKILYNPSLKQTVSTLWKAVANNLFLIFKHGLCGLITLSIMPMSFVLRRLLSSCFCFTGSIKSMKRKQRMKRWSKNFFPQKISLQLSRNKQKDSLVHALWNSFSQHYSGQINFISRRGAEKCIALSDFPNWKLEVAHWAFLLKYSMFNFQCSSGSPLNNIEYIEGIFLCVKSFKAYHFLPHQHWL